MGKAAKRARRKFTGEFKSEAVRIVRDGVGSGAEE